MNDHDKLATPRTMRDAGLEGPIMGDARAAVFDVFIAGMGLGFVIGFGFIFFVPGVEECLRALA